MDFVLNGRHHELDAETVRIRVRTTPPDPIRQHWIAIGDRRWPPKQAFRAATGLHDEPFTTHAALRVFRRLGFETSTIPGGDVSPSASALLATRHVSSDERAVDAFRRLDQFLSNAPLTAALAGLESRLKGAGRAEAEQLAVASGFDAALVDSALVVRERVGMLDSLIHAAVITQVLPMILDEDETVLKRPSLGAGNDVDRVFDLETTHRVAEFKLSSWKGHDGMRQRGLFADVVGLSLDDTSRRRQVFVVGELPVRFLTASHRNATKTLSKAALRVRGAVGIGDDTIVSDFTRDARIEVVDLTTMLPWLR